MDQALLVGNDIRSAQAFLDLLDKRGFDPQVLFLGQFEEYSEARLVISAPSLDVVSEDSPYVKLQGVIREMGPDAELPSLLIMKGTDPVIEALRKKVGPIESEYGKRLSSQPLGNRYLDFGYAFRIRSEASA